MYWGNTYILGSALWENHINHMCSSWQYPCVWMKVGSRKGWSVWIFGRGLHMWGAMDFFREYLLRMLKPHPWFVCWNLQRNVLGPKLEISHDIPSKGGIPGFLVEFHPYPHEPRKSDQAGPENNDFDLHSPFILYTLHHFMIATTIANPPVNHVCLYVFVIWC